jgi:DNA-3-methyladenine glycosylase I
VRVFQAEYPAPVFFRPEFFMRDDGAVRCLWACKSEPEKHYHDTEWGVPLRDERGLFEFLILEGAQAGLSWSTILNKRENYRKAFDDFDVEKIARYPDKRVEKLLANSGIVRNRLKVNATVTNARAWLDLREREGDLSEWLWQFVGGEAMQNSWQDLSQVPVNTPQSDAMSKALKDAGFKFVGTTICYAFMQATGMVNDHTTDCFRWAELVGNP